MARACNCSRVARTHDHQPARASVSVYYAWRPQRPDRKLIMFDPPYSVMSIHRTAPAEAADPAGSMTAGLAASGSNTRGWGRVIRERLRRRPAPLDATKTQGTLKASGAARRADQTAQTLLMDGARLQHMPRALLVRSSLSNRLSIRLYCRLFAESRPSM